jgi:hypothetical protein
MDFWVIAKGGSIPISFRIVGAKAPKTPSFILSKLLSISIIGTGFVV